MAGDCGWAWKEPLLFVGCVPEVAVGNRALSALPQGLTQCPTPAFVKAFRGERDFLVISCGPGAASLPSTAQGWECVRRPAQQPIPILPGS